ncbi:MAG: SH3 domain-containing protein [Caldilinea sp.]|nr:SH3 domain-containing protein [Caldilinea sp.]MDW8442150.1 SH3 domain-containing protein [Caldilineaceae bacterium]
MVNQKFTWIVVLMAAAIMMAGCQPMTAEQMASALAGQLATLQTPVAERATTPTVEPAQEEGAIATVTARSLRVRALPSMQAEVIAGVRQGEQYPVIGRSSDGLWLELAIPRAPEGRGWVSANFVTVSGSIADVRVVTPPVIPTPTPAPVVATEEAVEEPAEPEATPTPAEEPTAEATPAPTEEPVEEATPTLLPEEETSAVATPEPGFALVIAEGARLRVRAEPSTEAPIVGWLQPGEIIAVEEISEDGLWVRVPGVPGTQNLTGGWVLAEFLLLGQ